MLAAFGEIMIVMSSYKLIAALGFLVVGTILLCARRYISGSTLDRAKFNKNFLFVVALFDLVVSAVVFILLIVRGS